MNKLLDKNNNVSFHICMIHDKYRCTYLNDCRIHGNKPWSDEPMNWLVEGEISAKDLFEALPKDWKKAIKSITDIKEA